MHEINKYQKNELRLNIIWGHEINNDLGIFNIEFLMFNEPINGAFILIENISKLGKYFSMLTLKKICKIIKKKKFIPA